MNREWRDALGTFYVIQLQPADDPFLVKFGWTANLPVRFWQHRVNLKARDARVAGSWPCLRGWERRAILAIVGERASPVFGERYRCGTIDSLVERAQAFFREFDRTAAPCPPSTKPPRRFKKAPVIPVHAISATGTVTAQAVRKELGIPRYALYRMVDEGKIPYHLLDPEPWHKADRRRLRFKVSEVRAALNRLTGQPSAD